MQAWGLEFDSQDLHKKLGIVAMELGMDSRSLQATVCSLLGELQASERAYLTK